MISYRKVYREYHYLNEELQEQIIKFDTTKKEADRIKALNTISKLQICISELKLIMKNKRGI